MEQCRTAKKWKKAQGKKSFAHKRTDRCGNIAKFYFTSFCRLLLQFEMDSISLFWHENLSEIVFVAFFHLTSFFSSCSLSSASMKLVFVSRFFFWYFIFTSEMKTYSNKNSKNHTKKASNTKDGNKYAIFLSCIK